MVVFRCGDKENECIMAQEDGDIKFLRLGDAQRGKEILIGTFERELKATMMLHPVNSTQTFYLSLNRILNSMRHKNPEHRLLDCDFSFNDALLKSNSSIDDVLTASYSFYLLVTSAFLQMDVAKSLTNLLDDTQWQTIKTKLADFRQELENNQPNTLSVATWDYFLRKKLEEIKDLKNQVGLSFEDKSKLLLKQRLLCMAIDQNGDNISEEDCLLLGETLGAVDFKKFLSEVLSLSCPTSRLVTQCLNESAMVLIRATDMKSANKMKQTFCMARKISKDYSIEFIQDFGKQGTTLKEHFLNIEKMENFNEKEPTCRLLTRIQTQKCHHLTKQGTRGCSCTKYQRINGSLLCSNCSHIHKNLDSYEDLQGLPCLLILVDNGRMGDTFPKSLQCMDLRLHHIKSKQRTFLSSFVQEMGRMCRYTTLESTLPKALLGGGIYQFLKMSLKDRATFYSAFLAKHWIDSYVIYNESKTCFEAAINSADTGCKDNSGRKNHLLLQAEPQIGKTGTFLSVVGELRRIITKGEEEEDEPEIDDDSGDEEESDDDSQDSKSEMNAAHPYWKDISAMKSLPWKASESKYDRFNGGIFQYPTSKPRPIRGLGKNRNVKRKSGDQIDPGLKSFVTYKYEHDCKICPSDGQSETFKWSLEDQPLIISLPTDKRPFNELKLLLNKKDSKLKLFWITTPSYGRYNTAKLNLNHTMVDQAGVVVPFAHLVFVRKEEFESYRSRWHHSHAIITLPDKLDGDETADSGGIGFARKFIQMFCNNVGIKNYLQLDDNTRGFLAFKTGHKPKPDEESLYKILTVFQEISECRDAPFDWPSSGNELQPHPDFQDQSRLVAYTGPWEKFGVLGVRKFRPTHINVLRNRFSRLLSTTIHI